MRIFLNIVSTVIALYAVTLAYFNMPVTVSVSGFCPIQMRMMTLNVPFSSIVAAVFCMGFLSAVLWSFASSIPMNKKLKEYQRKLEKTSVTSDEESSKVAVLEAKIATLEKALESALKDK